MESDWKTLMDAGVPWGAIRTKPTMLDARALRGALRRVATEVDRLAPRQRDALHAWLGAFRGHWPAGFQRILGDSGARLLRRIESTPMDPNRYLKLKRIAVEVLANLV